ncbi:MAG: hypothetical protein ACKO70_03425 [Actinomycetota bacterium]
MASRASTTAPRIKRGLISLGWALGGVLVAILLWEGVKLLGTVITLPFETSDQAMPHVWTIASGAMQPEVRGSDTPVWQTVLIAAVAGSFGFARHSNTRIPGLRAHANQ